MVSSTRHSTNGHGRWRPMAMAAAQQGRVTVGIMELDTSSPPLLDNTPDPNLASFDPTLPSIRLVQQWIRRQQALVMVLHQGMRLEGRLLWQDPTAMALQLHDAQEPVLVQRRSIAFIHPAAVSPETAPWMA